MCSLCSATWYWASRASSWTSAAARAISRDVSRRWCRVSRRWTPRRRCWQPAKPRLELQTRGLFEVVGQQRCGPEPWQPSIDEYVQARHSQRSFSRAQMGASVALAFDAELRSALDAATAAGEIELNEERPRLPVSATVTWGRPRR
jgi:hypothetical protein